VANLGNTVKKKVVNDERLTTEKEIIGAILRTLAILNLLKGIFQKSRRLHFPMFFKTQSVTYR